MTFGRLQGELDWFPPKVLTNLLFFVLLTHVEETLYGLLLYVRLHACPQISAPKFRTEPTIVSKRLHFRETGNSTSLKIANRLYRAKDACYDYGTFDYGTTYRFSTELFLDILKSPRLLWLFCKYKIFDEFACLFKKS